MIPSVSSGYSIHQLFPKELYNSNKKLVLHFLIAHRNSFKKIQDWIQKIEEKGNQQFKEYLDYSGEDRCYKLSPLAVCVLVKDQQTAAFLIQKGASPMIPDIKGWTSFHHAAVQKDQQMLQLLETAQGVDLTVLGNLRSQEGGTYRDLQNLLNTPLPKPQDSVFYYRQENGAIISGTANQFRELTGALYTSSVVVTSSDLITLWANPRLRNELYNHLHDFWQKICESYFLNPPKIYLGKESSNTPWGFDVYVDQDISAFQGITVYGGRVNPHPADADYLLIDVDGKEIRNLGPMINDGFPNCMYLPVAYRGFSYDLFIAIREIKKGERLVWNYGISHSVKLNTPHFELNPKELEDYVRNAIFEKFTDLLLFFKSAYRLAAPSTLLTKLAEREKLSYLLETPSSQLYLLSKGLLPSEDICEILFQDQESLKKVRLNVERLDVLQNFAIKCDFVKKRLEAFTEEKQGQMVGEIQELLRYWSCNLSGQVLIDLIYLFAESLKEDIHSLEDWNRYKKDIKEYADFINYLLAFISAGADREEFKVKIKEAFKGLSAKKEQALKDVLFYAKEVPLKRGILNQLHRDLGSLITH